MYPCSPRDPELGNWQLSIKDQGRLKTEKMTWLLSYLYRELVSITGIYKVYLLNINSISSR